MITPHVLWDLSNPGSSPRVLSGHTDWILSVALTPDGKWALTGSQDNTARLWDLSNPGSSPRVLSGHKGAIFSIALTPDGKWALTGSKDNTLHASGIFQILVVVLVFFQGIQI